MDTPSLSSDILESQFGPTEVVVLQQDLMHRTICTKIRDTEQVLELSLVSFNLQSLNVFPHVEETMRAGESMGKAFRQHDVLFIREELASYRAEVPAAINKLFATEDPCTIVEVLILAGDKLQEYARILEVYSPVVDWPGNAIYKKQLTLPRADQLAKLASYLETKHIV